MDLDTLAKCQISDSLSLESERAIELCRAAREFVLVGNYEAARRSIESYWNRVGEPPSIARLNDRAQGEVLLATGILTSKIGASSQMSGAQDAARDLLGRSRTIFEKIDNRQGVIDAALQIGACYHREGQFDNARILIEPLLELLDDDSSELRIAILLHLALIYVELNQLRTALSFHSEISGILDRGEVSSVYKGMCCNEHALALKKLASIEQDNNLYALAVQEYYAASSYYAEGGHLRFSAAVENNVGNLLRELKRYSEARKRIARAQNIAYRLKDKELLAQFYDTAALVAIDEGQYGEAAHIADESVKLLRLGDHQALLAESLITKGRALSRQGDGLQASNAFAEAIAISELLEDIGLKTKASIALVEELPATYINAKCQAVKWLLGALRSDIDASLAPRAVECVTRLLESLLEVGMTKDESPNPSAAGWDGFSLDEALRHYEAQIIERAMADAGGSVRKASKLLGLAHHQTLQNKLNTKHKMLRSLKTHAAPAKSYTTKAAKSRAQDNRPRMFMPYDSLIGTGIRAESWLVIEPAKWSEVKPGDLIGVKTLEGDAAGYYNPQEGKVFLDPHNLNYDSLEFEQEEITELIGKVVGWHPSDDFDRITFI
jgi:tetratricopeptide (TPR) repeat protein